MQEAVPIPPELASAMEEFKNELNSLGDSVRLLEAFSEDYFMTLNQSGFRELTEILENLFACYDLCGNLLKQSKFNEVRSILHFVFSNKGNGAIPVTLTSLMPNSSGLFVNWSERFKARIEIVDKNVKEASKKFQGVGAVRKRTRSPTSLILGEVRKSAFGNVAGKPIFDKKKNSF